MGTDDSSPRRGFTPKFIEALKPGAAVREIADPRTPGLVLRLHPTGAKVFRWYVRSLGRVVTIGPWALSETPAHVTLGEARAWLERLKVARAAGEAQLMAIELQLKTHLAPRPLPGPSASAGTVNAVADKFLKLLDGQRKRPDMARYVVEKDILPVIGALPLRSVKKSDCRNVVARVVERGAATHAGKVLGLLKQLLDYAENVEDDFVNPAARLKASNLGVEANLRDRWLSDVEIPLFWNALTPDPAGSPRRSVPEPATAAALRLLLLTAARSSELRLARWTDVDLDKGTWTIPVTNQKLTPKQARQAKPFIIPLGPTALALFEELKEMGTALATKEGKKDPEWVLTSEFSRNGFLTDKALGRAMRRMWQTHPELKKLPEASPHDLRRTARTWLGKLGIAPHICERALNHSVGRIAKTYDQGDYLDERRKAAVKFDALVERLLSPTQSNVAFMAPAG